MFEVNELGKKYEGNFFSEVLILAVIGLACIVKHIMHGKEGCYLCGWHKRKVEEEKPAGATVSHKIKVEDEKRQGSRYGSSPIRY